MEEDLRPVFVYTEPAKETWSAIGDTQFVHDVFTVEYKGIKLPSSNHFTDGATVMCYCEDADGNLIDGTVITELDALDEERWRLLLWNPSDKGVEFYTVYIYATYVDGEKIIRSNPYVLCVQAAE